jgi:ribosomal protein S18 acetylase RimI-like enzyme
VRGGVFDIITVWFRLGRRTVRRLMETADRIQKAHARHAPGPHYYLEVIGVHPDHQGKGLGSRLMAPMLARADSERLPCYLETQTESNVAFYQKRGFEVVEVMDLPDGGPRGWLMLRPPPPSDQAGNA